MRGTVTDASGAVVAGAIVTLLHTEQNRPYTFTTNQASEYVLVQAPPGSKAPTGIQAEFFNILNHVNFAARPEGNTVFGRPQLGTVTDAERSRIIQMGLKFIW